MGKELRQWVEDAKSGKQATNENAKGSETPQQMSMDTQEKKGLLIKLMESLTDPQQWAVLDAEWRRGLKDLQNAVLNPWNGITATHEEPGTIANPTQQMVTREIDGRDRGGMEM